MATGPMNPYDSPEVGRPGMSGAAKLLLGLGIGCGVLVVLCCGFFGAGAWWLAQTAQHAVSKDPAKVRELTDQIVTIAIPDSLPPQFCMDVNLPIVGTKFITAVGYGDEHEGSGLFLAQFGPSFGNEENMKMQWRQSMRQNGQNDWEDIDVEKSEKHEVKVNGEDATFTVAQGHDSKKREVLQVFGAFKGKTGTAMLVLKVDAAEFTKEQVLAILDSMK